jgi:hypothetical protein
MKVAEGVGLCMADKFNLIEHFRNTAASLRASYLESKAYRNPTARGNTAEDLIREQLEHVLPDFALLRKGEVSDSAGLRSREFDIVVSERSPMLKLFESAGTPVIPIETVSSFLEVKSTLRQDHLVEFNTKLSSLDALRRFYRPTRHRRWLWELSQAPDNFTNFPVAPFEAHGGIPPIVGTIVAFEAPTTVTVMKWLQAMGGFPGCRFLVVCVLDQSYILFSAADQEWEEIPLHNSRDALPYLITSLLFALEDLPERDFYLLPESRRYIDSSAAQIPVPQPNE